MKMRNFSLFFFAKNQKNKYINRGFHKLTQYMSLVIQIKDDVAMSWSNSESLIKRNIFSAWNSAQINQQHLEGLRCRNPWHKHRRLIPATLDSPWHLSFKSLEEQLTKKRSFNWDKEVCMYVLCISYLLVRWNESNKRVLAPQIAASLFISDDNVQEQIASLIL